MMSGLARRVDQAGEDVSAASSTLLHGLMAVGRGALAVG